MKMADGTQSEGAPLPPLRREENEGRILYSLECSNGSSES